MTSALDQRLSVLDSYIRHLKVCLAPTPPIPCDSPQRFTWEAEEEGIVGYPLRRALISHARAAGCRVTQNEDGFEIGL